MVTVFRNLSNTAESSTKIFTRSGNEKSGFNSRFLHTSIFFSKPGIQLFLTLVCNSNQAIANETL